MEKKKLRILCDMDGVLENLSEEWIRSLGSLTVAKKENASQVRKNLIFLCQIYVFLLWYARYCGII